MVRRLPCHERPKLTSPSATTARADDTKKLGAIGDMHFVLETQNVDDDLIVVAGDNLFSDRLDGFGRFCRERKPRSSRSTTRATLTR